MKPADLLNKPAYERKKKPSSILKKKILSMITYLMARKMLTGQIKFWFHGQNFIYSGKVYNGVWVLRFNRYYRCFHDLFSVYWFLKDVIGKIKE